MGLRRTVALIIVLVAAGGGGALQARTGPALGDLLGATVLDPLRPGRSVRVAVSWRGEEAAFLTATINGRVVAASRLERGIEILRLEVPANATANAVELTAHGPDTGGRELTETVLGPSCHWSDRFAGRGPGHGLAGVAFDDGGGPALFVGGGFDTVGSGIATWDGASWAPLTNAGTGQQGVGGIVEMVSAVAVYDDGNGDALYVGGNFTDAGGVAASRIARWDGTNWTALTDAGTGEQGVNGALQALAVYDDGGGAALYVGGEFTTAGGVSATRIARWDGSNWTALADAGTGQEGTDARVWVLAAFDDGGGAALYAGGQFTAAGGVTADRIAGWDGANWTPLTDVGTGQQGVDSTVLALATYDDGAGPALYAGGHFATAGGFGRSRIARWDGASWTALTDANTGQQGITGSGSRYIETLAVYADGTGAALFAGGHFTSAGGVMTSNIARWDGTNWTPLTDAGTGKEGVDSSFADVHELAVFDDGGGEALYPMGSFSTAGGVPAPGIARWDGTNWTPLLETGAGHEGMSSYVHALAVYDSGGGPALYAAGDFTDSGGVATARIARWDGAGWAPLADAGTGQQGMDARVSALATYDDGGGAALYAGGEFTTAGGVPASRIARFDGTQWTALTDLGTGQEGTDDAVRALAVYDDGTGPALYAGGEFTTASGVPTSRIARWDGTNWTPLTDAGTGQEGVMGSSVQALATYDDGGGAALYASGSFSTAGGVPADHIARWDGANWTPLTDASTGEQGTDFDVRALATYDDGGGSALYAGGAFLTAGGVSASKIARWDGTNWAPLTDAGTGQQGTSSSIEVLTVYDDGGDSALYAGGRFSSAGGMPAAHVARWDGANWTPLTDAGTGIEGLEGTPQLPLGAAALAVYDDGGGAALYAGGDFTGAGGRPSAFLGAYSCGGDTMIFADGFESGDTSAWSNAVP